MPFRSVAEEAGELCRAILKRAQNIRGTREQWDSEVAKEIADLLITTIITANLEGWDIWELLEERWTEISKRDWVNNPQGHGLPQ